MYNKLVALIAIPLACISLAAVADYEPPEEGDTGFYKGKDTRADAAYFSPENAKGARNFRRIHIEPVNLAGVRIIQPEGAATDAEWTLSDVEDGAIQNAAYSELSTTLSHDAAFNIVEDPADADMTLHTTIVAIHPYATREEVEAGERRGGAITVSMALVNSASGKVMVRAVDTKSTSFDGFLAAAERLAEAAAAVRG